MNLCTEISTYIFGYRMDMQYSDKAIAFLPIFCHKTIDHNIFWMLHFIHIDGTRKEDR